MNLSRRVFIKYCLGSAAALGLDASVLGRLEKALAGETVLPKVIWINAANCTGCTVSLANLMSDTAPMDLADLLLNTIDLSFHPNLMGAAGDAAVLKLKEASKGDYVLAVDGGIPTAFNGNTCLVWHENGADVTAMEAVRRLAPGAAAVISIGTCASFGGMPAGNPNPTGIRGVNELTGISTINIPGCPPHPDWIAGTIAHLLGGSVPALDEDGRPMAYFSKDNCTIHKKCPRKEEEKAENYGVDGLCMKELGCKGPETQGDCFERQWNNKTSWCIGANAVCIGCTQNGFPDKFSPFFRPVPFADPSVFDVTKAEWKSDTQELKVEGVGTPGTDVSVFDAYTGVMIGSATVQSDTKWRVRVNNPNQVPCRVTAACGSQEIDKDVANAPNDCSKSPGDDTTFELKKAEWKADKKELKVEGVGTPGAGVSVFDAYTGAMIGSATVQSDTKWRVRVNNPNQVPCRVTAACGSQEIDKDVANAPNDCSKSPGDDTSFELKKAEWKADKKELKVEGVGTPGADVSIFDAYTGAMIGSTTIQSDTKWRVSVKNPNQVPCRVTAACGSQEIDKDVANAPTDCSKSPGDDTTFELKKAEWKADKKELKVEGVGTPGATVVVYNSGAGASIGSTTVQADTKWRVSVKSPSAVPCRVVAESGNHDAEIDVSNAPKNCT